MFKKRGCGKRRGKYCWRASRYNVYSTEESNGFCGVKMGKEV